MGVENKSIEYQKQIPKIHSYSFYLKNQFYSFLDVNRLLIAEVINLLESGTWQSLDDIAGGCSHPKKSIEILLRFLHEFDFVEKNNNQEYQLKSDFIKLSINTV